MSCCAWIQSCLSPETFRPLLDDACDALNGVEYDGLICTGYSSTIISSALAYVKQKQLVIVRKPNETRASPWEIEQPVECGRRVIFVDDMICQGITIERVKIAAQRNGLSIVGAYFYHNFDSDIEQFLYNHKIPRLNPFPLYLGKRQNETGIPATRPQVQPEAPHLGEVPF